MSTHFHVSGTGIIGPLTRRAGNYKWWVLTTAIFGAFVSILDATVVNTALPHIQLAFGTDLHTASYVVTVYLLAQGVVIAASGFSPIALGSNGCICFPLRCSRYSQPCVASPGISLSSFSSVCSKASVVHILQERNCL